MILYDLEVWDKVEMKARESELEQELLKFQKNGKIVIPEGVVFFRAKTS